MLLALDAGDDKGRWCWDGVAARFHFAGSMGEVRQLPVLEICTGRGAYGCVCLLLCVCVCVCVCACARECMHMIGAHITFNLTNFSPSSYPPCIPPHHSELIFISLSYPPYIPPHHSRLIFTSLSYPPPPPHFPLLHTYTWKGHGRSRVGLENGEEAAPNADMREVGVQGGEARPCGSKPQARHASASMALLLSSAQRESVCVMCICMYVRMRMYVCAMCI